MLCERTWHSKSPFRGSARLLVHGRGGYEAFEGWWYSNGLVAGTLKSGLAVAGDSLPSGSHTRAVVTPGGMPSAYTGAIVGLCMQPSNQPFNRSAKQQCCLVPVALRAPAPG